MQTIHKIVHVINNQVIIDLPSNFTAEKVEVILKPLTQEVSKHIEIEKEIDTGINSPSSNRSHREIFNPLSVLLERFR